MAQGGAGRRTQPEAPEPREDRPETTLESFVAKLQEEGVEAGRREAEQLTREAEAQARQILREARAEAERLREEAQSGAKAEQERAHAELRLAFRDAALELQASLGRVLEAILTGAVEERLQDAEFLDALVREVVTAYARSDATGDDLELRLAQESVDRLEAWSGEELAARLRSEGVDLDADNVLGNAGFELRVGDGTVEVTAASVTEKLLELVTPRLRAVVAEAMKEGG